MHQPCSFDKLWGLSEYKMARQMRGKTFEKYRGCKPCYGNLCRYGTENMFRTSENKHDTEDVFQNVYMKYLLYEGSFEGSEHEKAWFVRVTINACTDWMRYLSRRKWVSLEAFGEESVVLDEQSKEILEVVLKLPEKYRNVIYLFYYEEYSAVEIAKILGKKENTIYTWLSRAKEILREKLGGEWS